MSAAKIGGSRFHDLRHSAGPYLATGGTTLAKIAEVLGPKTLHVVKRYSHLIDQHPSKVVPRRNGKIFGTDRVQ